MTLTGEAKNWPTPNTAPDAPNGGLNRGKEWGGARPRETEQCLGKLARNWPSPRSEYSEACGNHPGAADSLNAVTKNWGTPRVTTNGGIPCPESTGKGSRLEDQAGLWQTPASDSFRSRGGDRKDEMGLDQAARLWTTPQAHDVTERGAGQVPTAKAGNACLARDARTWPGARDAKGENGEEHLVNGTGRLHLDQLPNLVKFLYSPPAPEPSINGPASSPDGPGSRRRSKKRLNPRFVELLMGWPVGWVHPGPMNSDVQEMALSSSARHWRSLSSRHVRALFLATMSGSTRTHRAVPPG